MPPLNESLDSFGLLFILLDDVWSFICFHLYLQNIAIQEHDSSSSEDDTEDSSSSSSSSKEEESSDDDESGLLDEVTTENIKLPCRTSSASNKRKRPLIEEIHVKEDSEAVKTKYTSNR